MAYKAFPLLPESRQVLGVSVFFQVLVIAITAWRFVARRRMRVKLGWDDHFTLMGAVLGTALVILLGLRLSSGVGYPEEEVMVNYGFSGKVQFADETIFVAAIIFSRLGALLFYLRIFPSTRMQWATKGIAVASTLSTFGVYLWTALRCHPVRMQWDLAAYLGGGHCDSMIPPYAAVCINSIVIDCLGVILPMPSIWRLQLATNAKIALSILLTLSLSVTAVDIWRLVSLYSLSTETLLLTANLENSLIIICSSFPAVWPLIKRATGMMSNRVKSSVMSTTGGSGGHGNTMTSRSATRTATQKLANNGSIWVEQTFGLDAASADGKDWNKRHFEPLEDSKSDYSESARMTAHNHKRSSFDMPTYELGSMNTKIEAGPGHAM